MQCTWCVHIWAGILSSTLNLENVWLFTIDWIYVQCTVHVMGQANVARIDLDRQIAGNITKDWRLMIQTMQVSGDKSQLKLSVHMHKCTLLQTRPSLEVSIGIWQKRGGEGVGKSINLKGWIDGAFYSPPFFPLPPPPPPGLLLLLLPCLDRMQNLAECANPRTIHTHTHPTPTHRHTRTHSSVVHLSRHADRLTKPVQNTTAPQTFIGGVQARRQTSHKCNTWV